MYLGKNGDRTRKDGDCNQSSWESWWFFLLVLSTNRQVDSRQGAPMAAVDFTKNLIWRFQHGGVFSHGVHTKKWAKWAMKNVDDESQWKASGYWKDSQLGIFDFGEWTGDMFYFSEHGKTHGHFDSWKKKHVNRSMRNIMEDCWYLRSRMGPQFTWTLSWCK